MAKYFFHFPSSGTRDDETGTELPNLASVRAQAVASMAQALAENGAQLWRDKSLHMEVTDEHGLILFNIDVIANEAPAMPRQT